MASFAPNDPSFLKQRGGEGCCGKANTDAHHNLFVDTAQGVLQLCFFSGVPYWTALTSLKSIFHLQDAWKICMSTSS